MSSSQGPAPFSTGRRRPNAAQVIIVSSVMFTFISFWRTAAVVLCDLASTAYYIGGIVEQSIGKAAPWFVLAVMVFSAAVALVYIESCSLFVRGGVYRVVKEAMGGFLGKLSVSALMFDYVLTGPISAVSAGQYVIGWVLESLKHFQLVDIPNPDPIKAWGSAAIAVLITLYFYRQNILGIHESSDKAMKIMVAVAIMGAVMLAWCGYTLVSQGPAVNVDGHVNSIPLTPDFSPKTDPNNGHVTSPLGFLQHTGLGSTLVNMPSGGWLSIVGLIGICIAFGHSVLAMSGEETLAQVYREVESPKLKNFKKAAAIVFVFSLILTGSISFFAVLLIPDDIRMSHYADNLIGGLAMSVAGPTGVRLALNAVVVVVGFLVLAGAVNTAIIGSNGVLSRVAEDGVVPDWFLRPHPRFGTNYRILTLIVAMQLFTIVASRGDVLVLGEAYAFGVVWSFAFKSLAMLVLRYTDKSPREFKVPLNIYIGRIEIPIGLAIIFLVLLAAAVMNLLTKETATIWGLSFTAAFLTVFELTERYTHGKRVGGKHQHLEQFNRQVTPQVTPQSVGLAKSYCKLVAIRSPNSMYMLEKALAETDPDTTDMVVMTAKTLPAGVSGLSEVDLDPYDRELMTAVVNRAEHAGKQVKPLIVPTNNPLHAVLQTVRSLGAQEVILGASNKFTAEEQLDQLALYWISMHQGELAPLTIRVLSRYWDVYLDLGGGNRIPKISERRARSIAELRAAGVGISRMMLVHDGSPSNHDLFQQVLTLVDPEVTFEVIGVPAAEEEPLPEETSIRQQDIERAVGLGREVGLHTFSDSWGKEIVRLAEEDHYDLIVLPYAPPHRDGTSLPWEDQTAYIQEHAHCRVFLAMAQLIPTEVAE
jgi:amino acid transporter/nucleotide-binding universal stress UspA family protein